MPLSGGDEQIIYFFVKIAKIHLNSMGAIFIFGPGSFAGHSNTNIIELPFSLNSVKGQRILERAIINHQKKSIILYKFGIYQSLCLG